MDGSNGLSRFWTGTAYNLSMDFRLGECSYSKWQTERCPETGRLHYQFYVETKIRKRQSQVQVLFPGAHIERCRNPKASIAYVGKNETRVEGPFEFGKSAVGSASPELLEQIKSMCVRDIIDMSPHLWRSVRQLREVSLIMAPPRSHKTQLWWISGGTGLGKTYFVSNLPGPKYYHFGGEFWDGYEQEETVVVDEYRGQFPIQLLLKLGDYTPLKVPYKGGYTQFSSKTVIFISNLSLMDIIEKYDVKSQEAILRRFMFTYFSS